jgi:hypothetical protein
MTNIGIENFRSLLGWNNFNLSDLTILTGTNNSGKSSLISAIRVLRNGLRSSKADRHKLSRILGLELNNSGDSRVGGFLKTLIHRDAQGKGIFSYSFQTDFKGLSRSYLTIIKFMIEDNNADRAYVFEILFKDIENETEFIRILNPYLDYPVIRLDFSYFARIAKEIFEEGKSFHTDLHSINELLAEAGENYEAEAIELIEAFKIRYTTELYIKKEDGRYNVSAYHENPFNLNMLSNEDKLHLKQLIENELIYELQHLLDGTSETREGMVKILMKYNPDDENKALSSFSKELCSFLSQVQWTVLNYRDHGHEVDRLLEYQMEDVMVECISLSRLLRLFANKDANMKMFKGKPSVFDIGYLKKLRIIANIEDLCAKMPDYTENVFIPFLNLILSLPYNKGLGHIKRSLLEDVVATIINEVISSLKENLTVFEDSELITSSRGLSDGLFRKSEVGEFKGILERLYGLDNEQMIEATWFISKWLRDFGIADGLILRVNESNGSFQAFLKIGEDELPLTEFGFGTIQLIPLLIGITLAKRSFNQKHIGKFLLIEEPESNLHPALQSKLADMFVEAQRIFEVRLLIETHSEYLIRKLQYLVAKGELAPEKTIIFYFNRANDRDVISGASERVKEITINTDGYLSDDFGPGFLDEANNISIALFGLNRNN